MPICFWGIVLWLEMRVTVCMGRPGHAKNLDEASVRRRDGGKRFDRSQHPCHEQITAASLRCSVAMGTKGHPLVG